MLRAARSILVLAVVGLALTPGHAPADSFDWARLRGPARRLVPRGRGGPDGREHSDLAVECGGLAQEHRHLEGAPTTATGTSSRARSTTAPPPANSGSWPGCTTRPTAAARPIGRPERYRPHSGRPVPERRLASVRATARRQVQPLHHVQRRDHASPDGDGSRCGPRAGVRVRGRRPPSGRRTGLRCRDPLHPGLPGRRGRNPNGLVCPARREHVRAPQGSRLRTPVPKRVRERRNSQAPDEPGRAQPRGPSRRSRRESTGSTRLV